jgi:pyruvate formate lyase activating enzyme
VWEAGVPLEIINLVIPGKNDDEGSILKLCEFAKSVSADIPLHFSKFYPYYKMSQIRATDEKKLLAARKTALDLGMKYAYIGNTYLPDVENTYCPKCNLLLVERDGFRIKKNVFEGKKEAICPKCGERINMIL